jgi:hypothetical protein
MDKGKSGLDSWNRMALPFSEGISLPKPPLTTCIIQIGYHIIMLLIIYLVNFQLDICSK